MKKKELFHIGDAYEIEKVLLGQIPVVEQSEVFTDMIVELQRRYGRIFITDLHQFLGQDLFDSLYPPNNFLEGIGFIFSRDANGFLWDKEKMPQPGDIWKYGSRYLKVISQKDPAHLAVSFMDKPNDIDVGLPIIELTHRQDDGFTRIVSRGHSTGESFLALLMNSTSLYRTYLHTALGVYAVYWGPDAIVFRLATSGMNRLSDGFAKNFSPAFDRFAERVSPNHIGFLSRLHLASEDLDDAAWGINKPLLRVPVNLLKAFMAIDMRNFKWHSLKEKVIQSFSELGPGSDILPN